MSLTTRTILIVVDAVTTTCLAGAAPGKSIDPEHARSFFEQAKQLSDRDDGRLWGVRLHGPMLFVDRATRTAVGNRPDPNGTLQPDGAVYVGTLPKNVTIANTAVRWSGRTWTMLTWPLPADERERSRLLAHEMFHRIQDELGLPASNPSNAHLDTAQGRLWLRLEWRALARAIESTGTLRRAAIEDAIAFRAYRRSLFAGAAEQERALENNEGLAEYTGVMLAGWNAAKRNRRVRESLREAEHAESFVRSFAYESGPPWCILLDEATPAWRKSYTARDDLGDRLAEATGVAFETTAKNGANARMKKYDGQAVVREEARREARTLERTRTARAKFVDGPTLRIPLRKMNIEFNPDNLQPLGDIGTVYPTLRISDVWGILSVSDGALVSADWTWVAVPVPADWNGDVRDAGHGWTLEAESTWHPRKHSAPNHGWHLTTMK